MYENLAVHDDVDQGMDVFDYLELDADLATGKFTTLTRRFLDEEGIKFLLSPFMEDEHHEQSQADEDISSDEASEIVEASENDELNMEYE